MLVHPVGLETAPPKAPDLSAMSTSMPLTGPPRLNNIEEAASLPSRLVRGGYISQTDIPGLVQPSKSNYGRLAWRQQQKIDLRSNAIAKKVSSEFGKTRVKWSWPPTNLKSLAIAEYRRRGMLQIPTRCGQKYNSNIIKLYATHVLRLWV